MLTSVLTAILNVILPFVGAQVFIEPGQSPERIESWFSTMENCGMKVCRIRMFESYMKREDGSWDFSMFDTAFESAARHGVGIWCTLFPSTEKTDIGGWKFPYDESVKEDFAGFIKAIVNHYKDAPALRGWVLINEPGIDTVPDTPFTEVMRSRWDSAHPRPEFRPNGYPVLIDTSESRFIRDLNTDFLRWIADEIAKYDRGHDIHVNPHAVFDNFAQYDFPAYREFLTSLGGSAHPAWHFKYFTRDEYAFAMMAQSEILRSGAGPLPWFMTEIQGGNNTYSGVDALCPTPEEIRQWLWTVIGCEGRGGIFWMLNPRASGIEAGEWAMLDFQDRPSDRLLSAAEVAGTLERNAGVFASAHEITSGIDILYMRNSLWAERLMAKEDDRYEGRRPGAVAKSSLACFRALSEAGLNVGIKAFEEYDFSAEDYTGKSIILSNQISVPDSCAASLESFVRKGGTLIVEGMTAFFDEDLHSTLVSGFSCSGLFGGKISEFILKDEHFNVNAGGNTLPAHLWEGKIEDCTEPVKVSVHGSGKVVWLPSCVSLGAWTTRNFKPLCDFLLRFCPVSDNAVAFDRYRRGMLLRSLSTSEGSLLICINKSGKRQKVGLTGVDGKAETLSAACAVMRGRTLDIGPEGVAVILYRK